jgi:hypothetical protein
VDAYSGELYFVGNGDFYGADARILRADVPTLPDALQPLAVLFKPAIWIAIIVSAILALLQMKQSIVARFILASDAILFAVVIPYTGWIIGYFITASHLIRVPWVFPFGIAIVYIGYYIDFQIMARFFSRRLRYSVIGSGLLVVVLAFAWAMKGRVQPSSSWQQQYNSLAELGEPFDTTETQPITVVGIPISLNEKLPVLSSSAKLLMARDRGLTVILGLSRKEAIKRVEAWQQITDVNTPPDVRQEILSKYDIRYIFVLRSQAADWITKVANEQPELYKVVAKEDPYILYKIQP